MSDLHEYLQSAFVERAMIGVVLIAVNAALSGVFASFRSLTYLVSGASHAALAGAALVLLLQAGGMLLGVSPIAGGAVFSVALALLAGHVVTRGSERMADPVIGIGLAFSMALAVLLISWIPQSATRVWGILLGDLLLLTPGDLWLLAALTAGLVSAFALCWKPFLFITFDTEGALAFGLPAAGYNYLLFGLIGLSSALIMKGVGAIVVFAMLVSPAATALLLGRSVRSVVLWSFCIATGAGMLAILLSFYTRLSVSALAALLASGCYVPARLWVWARGRRNGHRGAPDAREPA
jgi:ABC-type Mn2+/Zn2+ transport system permease subunit